MKLQCLGIILSALMAVSTTAGAQQKSGPQIDLGKREYDSKCASCHGAQGKGDGPNVPWLTRSPPDLTNLAKNNGGVLPVERMYEVIDGRQQVAGHGSRDMPVWGREYRIEAGEYYQDFPYDPVLYVRARILALIEYIYRLQAK